jgi:hypothetical protein
MRWITFVLLLFGAPLYAQTSLLPADRATVWAPGVQGIPTRTTVCATINAATYGNGASEASAGIQAAVDACPTGQVVKLSAGTFRMNSFVRIGKAVTVRGAGINATILQKTNGGKPNTETVPEYNPIFIVGPGRWPQFGAVLSLTADAVKGAFTVTVANATGLATGQFVLLDEDDYSSANWIALPPRNGVPTTVKIKASDNVVFQMHQPAASGEDDPVNAWFSRQGRPLAEIKEIASVSGNTVTFTTPIHITYPLAKVPQLVRFADPFVVGAGVEDLLMIGGSDGNIRFVAAAYCWVKNTENTVYFGEGVSIDKSFRIELRDSYIHDGAWQVPGGAGYAISLAGGASEALIENNIIMRANKMMVARSAGAGSVVGYNYADNGNIANIPSWVEVGINGSHMVGSHHMLFEGNESFNYDSDNTHGNAIYHTIFRNHLSGFRRDFPNGGSSRGAGLMFGSWWHSFIGNVIGSEGRMAGWVENSVGPNWTQAIWKLGYDPNHFEAGPDPKVLSTVIREGNFDYVTNQVKWTVTSQSLPDSLYLTSKPAFFGDAVWPWVTPEGSTKLFTLPAKARYDGAPVPTPSPTVPPTTTLPPVTTTVTLPPTPIPTPTPCLPPIVCPPPATPCPSCPTPPPLPTASGTCTAPVITSVRMADGSLRIAIAGATCVISVN